jgi:O-antigen ligase
MAALAAVLQALGVGLLLPEGQSEGIVGTLGNSNYLGAYLLFPLLSAAAIATGTRGVARYLNGALFTLILLALLLCRARAAWIGALASLIFAALLLKRIDNFSLRTLLRTKARPIALVTVIAAALLAGLWAAAPRTMQRTLDPDRWADPETLHNRMKYYRASWWLIRQNPLLGSGPGSYHKKVYEAQAALYRQDPDFFEGYDKPKPARVHNDYLEILNDGGALAAAVLAIFAIMVFRHGWQALTAEAFSRRTRIAAAGALAATGGEMVTAVFFFPFRLAPTLLLFAVMLGILEGLYRHSRQQIRAVANASAAGHKAVMVLIWVTIGALVWAGGLKPLQAELAFFEYRRALARGDLLRAQSRLESALAQVPDSSCYHRHAAQFYANHRKQYTQAEMHLAQALAYFNGEVPPWNIYQAQGDLALRRGDFMAARRAYQTALEYWPVYSPARDKLRQVEAFLAAHDKVVIPLP